MHKDLKNSFKELQKEEESRFDNNTQSRIRNSVNTNVGFLHFIGDLFELYLPKIFGLVVKMSGDPSPVTTDGKSSSSEMKFRKYPNTND